MIAPFEELQTNMAQGNKNVYNFFLNEPCETLGILHIFYTHVHSCGDIGGACFYMFYFQARIFSFHIKLLNGSLMLGFTLNFALN